MHLKQEANVRRKTRWAGRPTGRNMKRCALCHGKLGLGARFRNIWNGTWWVPVRFCSARCEAIYQDKQNDAAKERWHAFLAGGVSRSWAFAQIVKRVRGALLARRRQKTEAG